MQHNLKGAAMVEQLDRNLQKDSHSKITISNYALYVQGFLKWFKDSKEISDWLEFNEFQKILFRLVSN